MTRWSRCSTSWRARIARGGCSVPQARTLPLLPAVARATATYFVRCEWLVSRVRPWQLPTFHRSRRPSLEQRPARCAAVLVRGAPAPGTEHPPPSHEPARSLRQLEQLAQLGVGGARSSPGGRLTKTRGWSGPPILQHALHEPPGLHVLVAGDPGLWLLDVLQEVAAEPFEGLDQPLDVLLAQPRQLAGRRRHFGRGIRLVIGLRPVGDAWHPPREARSRPRAVARGACGVAGATAAGSDRGATDSAQSSRDETSRQLFNFT